MQNYVQVPYVADDGNTYISYQPIICPAQRQNPSDVPEVIRVPSVEYTLAEMIETFEARQRLYEPTDWVPSRLPSVEAVTRSAANLQVTPEAIVKGLLSVGEVILGLLGEFNLATSTDHLGSSSSQSRVLETVDLESLFREYAATKDAMRKFARDNQTTKEASDHFALQQIHHWVEHLLQMFFNSPSGSRYATLVRAQDTLITTLKTSETPSVQYLQRILGTCEMYAMNIEATSKDIGNLWTLHAVLAAALPPVISEFILQSIRGLVASVCNDIALRAGARGLVDQEVAAVIVDTLQDW